MEFFNGLFMFHCIIQNHIFNVDFKFLKLITFYLNECKYFENNEGKKILINKFFSNEIK